MYFPASQIKTGLYTNGGEFVLKESKKNYIGAYWRTSSSKYFTGKTPQDIVVEELELNISSSDENLTSEAYSYLGTDSTNFVEYQKLNSSFSESLIIPSSYTPKPNTEDYELGEFIRYFAKKTNEIVYIEINGETYEKLLSQDPTYLFQMYTPFKFAWKLTGKKEDVYFTNKRVTEYMTKTFGFLLLSKFLREDFLKFYI
jgi:hypothetical protein